MFFSISAFMYSFQMPHVCENKLQFLATYIIQRKQDPDKMSSNHQRCSGVLSARPGSYRIVNCVREYNSFAKRKINWIVQFVIIFSPQSPHSSQTEPPDSCARSQCLKRFFVWVLTAWSEKFVRAQYLHKPHIWHFKLFGGIFNGTKHLKRAYPSSTLEVRKNRIGTVLASTIEYVWSCSTGDKQDGLDTCVHLQGCRLTGVMETWWDNSCDWNVGMEGYMLLREDKQWTRGEGCVSD